MQVMQESKHHFTALEENNLRNLSGNLGAMGLTEAVNIGN
jgi:hypothetical protein